MELGNQSMNGNNPERRVVEFRLINGVFVQKHPVTVNTYPEIHALVSHLVEILENVYQIGVKHGMEIAQQEQPSGNTRFANPPCQDNTPDTTEAIQ